MKLVRYFKILIIMLGLLVVLADTLLSPVDSNGQASAVLIKIPPQATSSQVGSLLKEKGVIQSTLAFNLYSRFHGLASELKTGQYVVSANMSIPQILQALVDGRPTERSFTIPEGFTLQQITDLLVSRGFVDRQEFDRELAEGNFDYPFVKNLPRGPKRLEGYLYPDTYSVDTDTSAHTIINMMLQRFAQEMVQLDFQDKLKKENISLNKAVIIASMIEKEAKKDNERPIIASVIFNRLKKNMPLQIDSTVEYALGVHKDKLYDKDLAVDSPYNTYKIHGLPPGPIASPGERSLLAVINPAKTDFLYYVARPDGSHDFAKTLAQHNANKKRDQR